MLQSKKTFKVAIVFGEGEISTTTKCGITGSGSDGTTDVETSYPNPQPVI